MKPKILVTYASTHGSTEEIAGVIAGVLHTNGVEVDLLPVRQVHTVDAYRAVVLGAPLYILRLHKDALRFLEEHQQSLTGGIPLALFAGGSIETGSAEETREVRLQLDKELAKFPWLEPAAVEVVGGSFDPARLKFPWSLIPALKQKPACDLRDWQAIRDWAAGLVTLFQSEVREGGKD